jgi:integrase
MAAGYTLREIMEYLGHASLAATERYVKLLPQPDERGPADRLNDYVQRAAGRSGW